MSVKVVEDVYTKNTLGFWAYLMTDCMIFMTLFVSYAVLHTHTFGGVPTQDIYSLKTSFIQTMALLVSTVTCGLAVLSAVKDDRKKTLLYLACTFLLGAFFIFMELREFTGMIAEGNSFDKSAFLSSFFTLVGTHGFHISVGLLWTSVMIGQVFVKGITLDTFRRLSIFSLFWHFLDLVWIFIFTFVYLMGSL